MRHLQLLLAVLLVGCGADDQETPDALDDPDIAQGCDDWCVQQIACNTTSLSQTECVNACGADIGTVSAECAQALEALASCLELACDEQACDAELTERDATCGGTG